MLKEKYSQFNQDSGTLWEVKTTDYDLQLIIDDNY